MRRYAIRHQTVYGYRAPVDNGLHLLRLTPLTDRGQRACGQTLAVAPLPARQHVFVDHFGNVVHHIAIEATHSEFSVTLDAVVEVTREAASEDGPAWETVRSAMQADGFPSPPMVAEFVYPSPLVALENGAALYAAASFAADRPIVAALGDLARRIHDDFAYTPNATTVSTKVAEVLATRRGVCQDFAHLMIAGLRGLGLPARYVSGYLRTARAEDGAARRGYDASHAWVSAWCGAALGWVDLDPTNDRLVADEHVAVAYGRDFSDVTPLRGVILGGGSHTLSVAVSVTDLDRGPEADAAGGAPDAA
ncbi:MAG TPA: transglutaminase family protein [Stellaceae bacterium]|nr:transglutaminase family protein [Stellaceae bacterium]